MGLSIAVYSREDLAEILLRRFNMNACMECQNKLLSNMVYKNYESLVSLPDINTDRETLENVFQYIRFGYYSMVCDYTKSKRITPKSEITDEQREVLYEYKMIVDSLNKVARNMGFNIGKDINNSSDVIITTMGYQSIMSEFFEEG